MTRVLKDDVPSLLGISSKFKTQTKELRDLSFLMVQAICKSIKLFRVKNSGTVLPVAQSF